MSFSHFRFWCSDRIKGVLSRLHNHSNILSNSFWSTLLYFRNFSILRFWRFFSIGFLHLIFKKQRNWVFIAFRRTCFQRVYPLYFIFIFAIIQNQTRTSACLKHSNINFLSIKYR